eukprot:7386470-Prymnesium_polylepis.1
MSRFMASSSSPRSSSASLGHSSTQIKPSHRFLPHSRKSARCSDHRNEATNGSTIEYDCVNVCGALLVVWCPGDAVDVAAVSLEFPEPIKVPRRLGLLDPCGCFRLLALRHLRQPPV